MSDSIRDVERDVLDREYIRFNIMHRDQYLAITHLLKVVGDYWRNENLVQETVGIPALTMFLTMLGGVGHCIRWVTGAHDGRRRLPNATWQELDQEALDFLVWGMRYHKISSDHIAWSRGVMQASIDEINKVITFSTYSTLDSTFFLSQHNDYQRALEALHHSLPVKELQRDFKHWWKHFRVVSGGFDFAEDVARQLESYPMVLHWLETSILPGVQASEDLGGYSLDEFRCFFAALFMNFTYWTLVEDYCDDRFGEENDFGTTLLTLPHSDMIHYLQCMSGIRIEAVEAIVQTLTYDVSNLHALIMNQPFVQSSDMDIFLLPRLIVSSDPNRMLTGAMNKGAGRQVYDRLIESLSRVALSELAAVFRGVGLEVWQEEDILSDGEKLITPDLIVFDRATGELLVADYKHSLSPIGTSEVVYKLDALKHGYEQIRDYLSVMRNPTNYPIQLQGLRISNIMGSLIFGSPMLIPIHIDPEVVVTNRFSLCEQLTPQLFTTLSSLMDWARKRPELPFQPDFLREEIEEIQVADWTYKRPKYVGDESYI